MTTLAERFWAHVNKDGPVPPHMPHLGPCWLWTTRKGGLPPRYAVYRYEGHHTTTHRIAWMIVNGPIPNDLLVCHHCDNHACVRPEHLFLGTNLDNKRDCMAKGRTATGERSGTARLSEDAVREIRRLFKDGETNAALARRFGVHYQTIYFILRGDTWRHVL